MLSALALEVQELAGLGVVEAGTAGGQANIGPPTFASLQRAGDILGIPAERDGTINAPVNRCIPGPEKDEQDPDINHGFNQHISPGVSG